MLDCNSATLLMTKQSFDSVSCVERIQLKMHLSVCSFCRAFKKQSDFIQLQIKKWSEVDPDHPVITLSDEQKEKLKERIKASGGEAI